MRTEQIMYMVYDYADAFHNRIDSIGEVEVQTQKELKHSQMEIGKQIKAAIEALVAERDALKAGLAQPEHQPLTDEDIKTMYLRAHDNNMYMGWLAVAVAFARAIEAKLKEKNT